MFKTLSQKSSFQLFFWGILLLILAVIADAALDSLLFGEGTFQQQLFSPSYHEISIRLLFGTFILAAIYLGMHFLANTGQRERALQQLNNDLGLVRQDLEEFHDDLSRQLRNSSSELATSIEMLKVQCGHSFDEKTKFFMENVCRSSDKINEQLETNLILTELPFGEPRRERVKLDHLAVEVVDELKSKQPDLQVDFKIQPWVNAWCDKKMLRLIIYYLFSNAIDFIPEPRAGHIEFGMFNRNGQKVFFVRDNGTGFSDAQAKRLFDPFWDRSQDTDLPTDTIKLTNARRIVHRHGGQIWAEGIQGTGGTIFFTYYKL